MEAFPRWLIRLAEPGAPVIGRTIAAVKWRQGYLRRQPAAIADVRQHLRPLDVIIVGNKGKLTGHTIPGLFSHGAAYLGNERELRAMGLWDDPAVKPNQTAIRNGRSFIESDQRGVHLSKAEAVLGADWVVVLRPRLAGKAARKHVGQTFFQHIGTRFDFHFDTAEDKRLFCLELIAHTLGKLDFPKRDVYGRQTIIPDDILVSVLRHRLPLDVVIYVRGERGHWHVASSAELLEDIRVEWRR